MTGRSCTDEVQVKVPSFHKVTLLTNIKYSSDIISIYILISWKLFITAVIEDEKESKVFVTIELSVSLLR